MFILRAILFISAIVLFFIGAGLTVIRLWWAKWPPYDADSILHSWLTIVAVAGAGVLLVALAIRLGDRRSRVRLAAILPYPMNNDG